MPEPTVKLVRLLLDAASSFPYNDIPSSIPARERTAFWSGTARVSEALHVIPAAKASAILKFRHPKDAALSLGSQLLKQYAIMRLMRVSWKDVEITQTETVMNGKPYYAKGGISFNVSHHGAVVVLVASTDEVDGRVVEVGVDVMQAGGEESLRGVRREGSLEKWIAIFEDVFPETTLQDVLSRPLPTSVDCDSEDEVVTWRLRLFYSYWSLVEAYIKMTGDALMAEYLTKLVFEDVQPPEPFDASTKWESGPASDNIDVVLDGQRQSDVTIALEALGEEYVVATAASHSDVLLHPFEIVDVERDILPIIRD